MYATKRSTVEYEDSPPIGKSRSRNVREQANDAMLVLLTVIRRVQAHPCEELLEDYRNFFETFVILHIVLYKLTTGDAEVRLLL